MLTFNPLSATSATSEAVADKYISVQGGASSSTIVYTVPENRKFVGYWYGSNSSNGAYINGFSATAYPNGTTARGHVPVTMGPSFTFSSNSNNILLIGVESNV
tara:strand:+ start:2686 stop:2994 length:309 start_codon:yes stop_codon:yes gene_type:complete